MEFPRLLECLAADFALLRAAAASADPETAVPTCPGWSVADLTRHVGHVYLHKALAMRLGGEPEWPPKELPGEAPLALLDRAHAELLDEFAARPPEERTNTWYGRDPSVGFWIRRMAQETVIHRIDAELATGQPVSPVPADLAIDGIDELLKVFVAYGVTEWGQEFTDVLSASPGRTYTVRTDGAAWRISTGPGLFTVEDGAGPGPADATIEGTPAALLRRLWSRETPDEPSTVTVDGPPDAVEELHRCIAIATQ